LLPVPAGPSIATTGPRLGIAISRLIESDCAARFSRLRRRLFSARLGLNRCLEFLHQIFQGAKGDPIFLVGTDADPKRVCQTVIGHRPEDDALLQALLIALAAAQSESALHIDEKKIALALPERNLQFRELALPEKHSLAVGRRDFL